MHRLPTADAWQFDLLPLSTRMQLCDLLWMLPGRRNCSDSYPPAHAAPSAPGRFPATDSRGLILFSRYCALSRDEFTERVTQMIAQGAFSHIGHAIT